MVTLTKEAAKHVTSYLGNRGKGVGIRLAVKTTGCSGLMYVLEPVDKELVEDQLFNSEGINVYVDPKSMIYLSGTRMDYIKSGLNEGFEFTNPNQTAECGCGESFTV
jgi:iron-sulfur cluster assembly protein